MEFDSASDSVDPDTVDPSDRLDQNCTARCIPVGRGSGNVYFDAAASDKYW